MSARMQSKIKGKKTKPLYWHSAHVSTIQSVMAGLGIEWGSQYLPPYASWLSFELYQDNVSLQWSTLATFHAGDRNLFDNVDSSFTQVFSDYCAGAGSGCAADPVTGHCPWNCTLLMFRAQGLSVPDWNSEYGCNNRIYSSATPFLAPAPSSDDTTTPRALTILFAVLFGVTALVAIGLAIKLRSIGGRAPTFGTISDVDISTT